LAIMDQSGLARHTSPEEKPAVQAWLGEGTLLVHYLRRQGVLDASNARVQVARRRFGREERRCIPGITFRGCTARLSVTNVG
jgi:hypothetical protein